MPDTDRGLYPKYRVERRDGNEKHRGCACFVLDLDHDPHALPAIAAYATSCQTSRPALARDLRAALAVRGYTLALPAELNHLPEPPATEIAKEIAQTLDAAADEMSLPGLHHRRPHADELLGYEQAETDARNWLHQMADAIRRLVR